MKLILTKTEKHCYVHCTQFVLASLGSEVSLPPNAVKEKEIERDVTKHKVAIIHSTKCKHVSHVRQSWCFGAKYIDTVAGLRDVSKKGSLAL